MTFVKPPSPAARFKSLHKETTGHDVKQFMLTLGDRINCFHVHDNDGGHDNHQAPYTGKAERSKIWKRKNWRF